MNCASVKSAPQRGECRRGEVRQPPSELTRQPGPPYSKSRRRVAVRRATGEIARAIGTEVTIRIWALQADKFIDRLSGIPLRGTVTPIARGGVQMAAQFIDGVVRCWCS